MADDTEDNDVPSMLLPCVSCNRTFRPEALAKHFKVCEKSLMKKRKKFDSSKQRIQGTELAEFLPILPTFTKKVEKSPVRKPQTKWREKHNELVQTIQATRLPPGQAPVTPIKPSDQEQCPYCERTFGPKAYDRHLEWCKEKQIRIQPKSPASQRAKERLEARTKYRAPTINRGKRSVSRDKLSGSRREPSPSPHNTSHTSTPLTPSLSRKKPAQVTPEVIGTQNINQSFMKGTPLRSSTRGSSSARKTSQHPSGSELYDPFKSAEQQMQELLEPEAPQKLAPIIKTPVVLSSPSSAFTKFSPIQSPQPLFILEDDKDSDHSQKTETKSHHSSEKSDSPLTVTSCDNLSSSKDSNQNPISLSTLSLCSTISIESVDGNKNGYRLGYSSSAKTVEKKTPAPLRRTVSALESRRGRDPLKGKLKMEDMLYGSNNSDGERYFGSPLITGQLDKDPDDFSSSGSFFKSVYDAETLTAEQELLKSMCEFEKLLSSSSSSSPSPSSPSSKLFPSLVSSFHPEEAQKLQHDADLRTVSQSGGPDSAYSSLNRKSPVGGEGGDQEREVPCPTFTSTESTIVRFCHECGAKYPVLAAKFCCQCGVRRLVI